MKLNFYVYLAREDLKYIKQVSRDHFPRECCGLIGLENKSGKQWLRPLQLPNRSRRPHSFRMWAKEVQEASQLLTAQNAPVSGCFHSHVHYPARPSPTDLRSAKPGELWLIYSLQTKQIHLFERKNHRFQKLYLEIL